MSLAAVAAALVTTESHLAEVDAGYAHTLSLISALRENASQSQQELAAAEHVYMEPDGASHLCTHYMHIFQARPSAYENILIIFSILHLSPLLSSPPLPSGSPLLSSVFPLCPAHFRPQKQRRRATINWLLWGGIGAPTHAELLLGKYTRSASRLLAHKMSDSQEKTDQNTTDDQHHHCHHVKDDEPTPIKAQAVLASAEIGRMTDLGLGRGVDATDPRPWLDKSSFQVRRVAIDSVIGTEEGGSVMSFATSVSSVVNQQGEFKASVAVPRSPITVGVDAELSRGNNTTRRSIGRKVVNRTVSFREDFEDTVAVSSTPEEAVQEASAVATKSLYTAVGEVSDSRISDASSGTTFQERLARWIVERILHREKIIELELGMKGKPPPIKRVTFSGDPEDDLAEYIHKSTADERKLIVKDCHDFVNHFHITHYVCAIQLGASEYRVLDESDYFTALSTVGSLGLETLTTVALTGKSSKKVTMKASEKKSIGTISKNGTVARGSYNEAVVGVSFRPITSLLKLRYLYLSMRKALLDYMGSQADTTSECILSPLSLSLPSSSSTSLPFTSTFPFFPFAHLYWAVFIPKMASHIPFQLQVVLSSSLLTQTSFSGW